MCMTVLGAFKFNSYQLVAPNPVHWTEEVKSLNNIVEVKTSSIPGAGLGVFTTQTITTGEHGRYLCAYYGELLNELVYEAIVDDNYTHFTGIHCSINCYMPGVFRGIPNTLGVTINSVTTHREAANVEYKMDESKIDNKSNVITCDGLMSVWIRPNTTIALGAELFSYYSKSFWSRLKRYREELKEDYCCVCLLYHSLRYDKLVLCDNCNNGFHIRCLQKLGFEFIDCEMWYCLNCVVQ
jgi:hypothetical protein